jgi:hypothetical protein
MTGGLALATRDFALLTMAANLVAEYPSELVFKGGFVLRHVHDVLRFSKDVDATRHDPPGQRIDAQDVAKTIESSETSTASEPSTPPRCPRCFRTLLPTARRSTSSGRGSSN